MFRVVSANLNGIRSAVNKGFFEWMNAQGADVVCVQELKAQEADLSQDLLQPQGWHTAFQFAEKKGYSGVGIYSRHKPVSVQVGFGCAEFDAEGRYVCMDFDAVSVVSLYLPSGSSAPERQEAKFRFLDAFVPHMHGLLQSGREFILCGDWNIAHQEIDLKNWKGNLKNSGFLPEERAWMTQRLHTDGWVDTYRRLHPHTTDECYTWWSNRGQAYANNVGWRIDYQIVTPDTGARARQADIYKTQRFSDHAPLTIAYDMKAP
jgi:exodeoxyribonuclease-3